MPIPRDSNRSSPFDDNRCFRVTDGVPGLIPHFDPVPVKTLLGRVDVERPRREIAPRVRQRSGREVGPASVGEPNPEADALDVVVEDRGLEFDRVSREDVCGKERVPNEMQNDACCGDKPK